MVPSDPRPGQNNADFVERPALYIGPVIDCHHHLWDLSMGRHPWLAEGGMTALGDLSYLRHDYLPADFASDATGTGVVASVCVEALWDSPNGPMEEIAWFDSLDRPAGVAGRYVAKADLAAPDVEIQLERLAAHPRVAGVRQTIRWHPDPVRRMSDRILTDDPAWLAGVGRLQAHGLVLELLVYPWQAQAVFDIAQSNPDLPIVVNHCSSPIDRDEAGIARWKNGLGTMARVPNVHLKLSNFAKYSAGGTIQGARDFIGPCILAFGASRCLWGSDYPVARSTLPYRDTLKLFREAIGDRPAGEQQAMLFGNTARLYRMDVAT